MKFKRKCEKCGFDYEYEGYANFIVFCPNCNDYVFAECEYGYGSVVPCRIYYGSEIVGMVTYDKECVGRYRIDSDIFYIHKVLEKTYLEALFEAKDMLAELIKERNE